MASAKRTLVISQPSGKVRCFVSGIPFIAGDSDLFRFVEDRTGQLVQSAYVVTEKNTGRPRGTGCSVGSRGFGFVTFASQSEADAAIVMLRGATWGDQPIRLELAKRQPCQPRT